MIFCWVYQAQTQLLRMQTNTNKIKNYLSHNSQDNLLNIAGHVSKANHIFKFFFQITVGKTTIFNCC